MTFIIHLDRHFSAPSFINVYMYAAIKSHDITGWVRMYISLRGYRSAFLNSGAKRMQAHALKSRTISVSGRVSLTTFL